MKVQEIFALENDIDKDWVIDKYDIMISKIGEYPILRVLFKNDKITEFKKVKIEASKNIKCPNCGCVIPIDCYLPLYIKTAQRHFCCITCGSDIGLNNNIKIRKTFKKL